MGNRAQLDTQIRVTPSRSQNVLVTLVILSGICFLIGFLFLWKNKEHSWVPLVIGLVVLIIACIGWLWAQKDTDLADSKSTSVSDSHGNQIITDTRALSSPQVIQNLAALFNLLSHREPLPEPDGVIDDFGKPVPSSIDEARKRVAQANLEAQEIANLAIKEFGANFNEEGGIQPMLDEPCDKRVIDTNKAG